MALSDPADVPPAHPNSPWRAFVDEVIEAAGEWCDRSASSENAARQAATRLRGTAPALADPGLLEVRRAGTVVYARLRAVPEQIRPSSSPHQ